MYLYLIGSFSSPGNNPYEELERLARSIPNSPNLIHGIWSLYVLDTKSNNVIVEINSKKTLAPASNLKILVSVVALDLLGENKTFNTYLAYSGEIDKNGVLNGDLYIRGEGDPTLGSSDMPGVLPLDSLMDKWVNIIANQGIKTINGNIIGDDSYLDYMPLSTGWFWSDIGNYYAANTSGLCINENLYHLYFKPGKWVGGKAEVLRTEPVVPGLSFFNHMKTGPVGSGDNGFIYAAPWQYLHQLEGTIPKGVKEFSIKGALPDPAKFTAQALFKKLNEHQIQVNGLAKNIRELSDSDKEHHIFYSSSSPQLKDIVYRLNKKSVNLYADQLLKILGKEITGTGSYEKGFSVIENWLDGKNIYSEGLSLNDGSGLSRANTTSTRLFAEMLQRICTESYFDSFYNSLGIAGDPDDISYMKNMGRGTLAAKNLRAKTGSITQVRAHSGYVSTRSGKFLSFSMIANNYTGSRRGVDRLHEKIMVALANLP
jgi:D-alanyl-D-alanine carboxypeptidase/D-alanyl-D-alanine-endopeptidase (penicillin-binding protein 4)